LERFKSLPGGFCNFFGITSARIVYNGQDYYIPQSLGGNSAVSVHTIMFRMILKEYGSIPDGYNLGLSGIRFFYDGLRAELKELAKNGK
jgi:hypothetical protein